MYSLRSCWPTTQQPSPFPLLSSIQGQAHRWQNFLGSSPRVTHKQMNKQSLWWRPSLAVTLRKLNYVARPPLSCSEHPKRWINALCVVGIISWNRKRRLRAASEALNNYSASRTEWHRKTHEKKADLEGMCSSEYFPLCHSCIFFPCYFF